VLRVFGKRSVCKILGPKVKEWRVDWIKLLNEEALCYLLLIKYHSSDHIKLDDIIAAYCKYEREKKYNIYRTLMNEPD